LVWELRIDRKLKFKVAMRELGYFLARLYCACHAFHSLFEFDKDAGHIISAGAVAVGGVHILANNLVKHIFDDLGA